MTRGRRRRLWALSAVVVVIASIVVPLEVVGATRHTSTPGGGGTSGENGTSGYTVPSDIASNCSTDVTSSLSKWLYTLPQGAPGHMTHVNFGRRCYLVNGEIYLRGFEGFVFDGQGAIFEQRAPSLGLTRDSSLAIRPAYCGYTGWKNPLYTEILKVDIMWLVEGGCDLTFENMTIAGSNNGRPGGDKEQDSFMAFDGAQRVLVQDVTMRGPYGDYVDAQGLHEAPDGGGAFPTTDLTVRNCRLSGAGREGFGIILAKRVTITDDTIMSAADTIFDIEFDSIHPAGLQEDMLISDNTIVGQHYAFLVAAFTAAKIERVRFTGNRLSDGGQLRIWIDPAIQSFDIRVDHNSSADPPGWPRRASVTLYDTIDSEVDHNSVTVKSYLSGDQGDPFATGGPGVEVDHNTIAGDGQGRPVVAQGGAESCSNVSPTNVPYDPPCRAVAQISGPVTATLPS